MVKSLRTEINQTAKSYFRIISLPIKNSLVPIRNSVLRHKLPVFMVSSLLLLSAPVGVAHLRSDSDPGQASTQSEAQLDSPVSGVLDENLEANKSQAPAEQPIQSGNAGSGNASSTNLSVDSQNTNSQQSTPPKLTINGQNIPVPANGSVHKNVQSNNQSVDVRINNNSSSSDSQSSSLNIQIQSHNTSSGSGDDSTTDRGASRLTPRDRGY